MQTRTLTILFTDLKDFTSRTSQQSRSVNLNMIRLHRQLLAPPIERRGGRVVKEIGDAFMAVFDSPTNAALSALDLQQNLADYNAQVPKNQRLEVKAGLCTGEVALEGNDVFGEAVNIASRVQKLASPNEILLTDATYLTMNRSEVKTARLGLRSLDGVPEKIGLHRVSPRRRKNGSGQETAFQNAPGVGDPDLKPAPTYRRILAFCVDLAVAAAVARLVLQQPLWPIEIQPTDFLFFGTWAACGAALAALGQAVGGWTIGKLLMDLRAVRIDGRKLGWKKGFLRSLLFLVSALPAGLGLIWGLFDRRRQTWHDKIIESMVVCRSQWRTTLSAGAAPG